MEIHLSTEESIRLTTAGEGVAFVPRESASLSPFHLLAASLATCTHAVLHSYGHTAGIPLDDLAVDVSWEFGGAPYRVSRMRMTIDWPALPAGRRGAARRAAAQCTVHHTLEQGSHVETHVKEPAS